MSEIPQTVLVLGATSDVGRALAHEYAAAGASLQLGGRDPDRLAADRDDLAERYGVRVTVYRIDVLADPDHDELLGALDPLPDIVVCVVGLMEPQAELEMDPQRAERVMQTNFNAPARLLGRLANACQARGSGTIIGVSSVAGDRGRATNYVYGAAKAGFSAWLSGLRNRLHGSGVRVMTIKPGFVRTRMTEGMNLPALLTASPAELARAIHRAQIAGRDVVYYRRIWRLIMIVIRVLPEWVFKRLSL